MLCVHTPEITLKSLMTFRTYSELIKLHSFEERYSYLKLRGTVGLETFGHDRYMNQRFYTSKQWRDIRDHVIARDEGMDLALKGHEIYDKIVIHHMNPMTVEELESGSGDVLDPEFLITTTHRTHNAIHYGDERHLPKPFVERAAGDTKLW